MAISPSYIKAWTPGLIKPKESAVQMERFYYLELFGKTINQKLNINLKLFNYITKLYYLEDIFKWLKIKKSQCNIGSIIILRDNVTYKS